jgi:hypothetical protein
MLMIAIIADIAIIAYMTRHIHAVTSHTLHATCFIRHVTYASHITPHKAT